MFEKEESSFFCKTMFFSKSSSGHIERKFGHTAIFCSQKSKKILLLVRITWKKFTFFEKKNFSGLHRMQFWRYIRTFFLKKSQSDKMGYPKFKKNPKNFLWICNMQFRERSKKIFCQRPESFSLKVWKIPKHFSLLEALFLSKSSYGQLKCQVWQLCRIFFSTKVKDVSVQGPNMKRKAIGFSKTSSSSKERFFGHVGCSFETSHEIFWPKVLKLNALSPRIMEKITFFENKLFFQNYPQGSLKAVLTNALNCFC